MAYSLIHEIAQQYAQYTRKEIDRFQKTIAPSPRQLYCKLFEHIGLIVSKI